MSTATAAKPAASTIGGGIAFAATTATAPTSANAALGTGFTNVGFISSDGVRRNITMDTQTIKAWGGEVALATAGGKTETFRFKIIEAFNVDVLGLVLGSASGTLSGTGGITVNSTAGDQTPKMWVITMLEADGVTHRIVIPKGLITGIGEIQYADGSAEGYELTVTAMVDDSGKTAYEYLKAATTN